MAVLLFIATDEYTRTARTSCSKETDSVHERHLTFHEGLAGSSPVGNAQSSSSKNSDVPHR
jgi:phage portal protein BeeE